MLKVPRTRFGIDRFSAEGVRGSVVRVDLTNDSRSRGIRPEIREGKNGAFSENMLHLRVGRKCGFTVLTGSFRTNSSGRTLPELVLRHVHRVSYTHNLGAGGTRVHRI